MLSHKNCTHPATGYARRECRLKNGGSERQFPPEPPATANPKWKPKPRQKPRVLVIDGERVTQEAFRSLRYVHGWEVVTPLARVDSPPGPWDGFGIVGRDNNGHYVRASHFEWEATSKTFDALPLVNLADHKRYGDMNEY